MNVFRLVLCLAGLTIYLVVRQFLHQSALGDTPRTNPAKPAPEVQQAVPKPARPQTNPHIEVLKPDTAYAEVH